MVLRVHAYPNCNPSVRSQCTQRTAPAASTTSLTPLPQSRTACQTTQTVTAMWCTAVLRRGRERLGGRGGAPGGGAGRGGRSPAPQHARAPTTYTQLLPNKKARHVCMTRRITSECATCSAVHSIHEQPGTHSCRGRGGVGGRASRRNALRCMASTSAPATRAASGVVPRRPERATAACANTRPSSASLASAPCPFRVPFTVMLCAHSCWPCVYVPGRLQTSRVHPTSTQDCSV